MARPELGPNQKRLIEDIAMQLGIGFAYAKRMYAPGLPAEDSLSDICNLSDERLQQVFAARMGALLGA